MRDWSASADRLLFDAIRIRRPLRADGRPRRLVTAAHDLMALGGDAVRLLVLAGCVAALIADGRPATAGLLAASYAVARVALFGIKRIVRRARPDSDAHDTVTYTSSFPSGHTFMTVVLYLSIALLVPAAAQTGVAAVGIVIALATGGLIGAIRVALGVHWPSDVAAGWSAGIAWATGGVLLADALGIAR